MDWICKTNVLIVGLGMIGGSYAAALKRLGYTVTALDTRKEAIGFALEKDMIDKGAADIDEKLIGEADAVIFALYPGAFKEWIKENQHLLKSGALLTDVTGVKACIVYDIQEMLRQDVEFIAAHPMAGREKSGVEYSDPSVFRDANYIVTPTAKNTETAIEWCKNLGRILGFAHIAVLSPEEHDRAIGFVSQLTHTIAIALMTCNDNQHLAEFTGDSFRDLTRIANINDVMWSELFLRNKACLIEQMDSFIKEFETIRDLIDKEDVEELRAKMRLSTARRSAFDRKK